MIKLDKIAEPELLKQNASQWLKVIKDKLASGETPTLAEISRYRHPKIKAALIAETHGKCAYCEGKLLDVTFGDVEHISPKSSNIDDTYRWSNLTLACDACNTHKKDGVGIVDPYIDDPAAEFKFIGPMIFPKNDKSKALKTVKKLKLNRSGLIESRSKKIDYIYSLVLLIRATADPETKSVLIDDLLINETAEEVEFVAFVRSFIEDMKEQIC